MKQVRTYPGGRPVWTRDATLNDSDKSFTVPAGKVWAVYYIRGDLTTTATVGNRVLVIRISDGTNYVRGMVRTTSIAASKTGVCVYEEGGIGTTTNTTNYETPENGASPDVLTVHGGCAMYLPAGYVIRVYDIAAVDAAADDLTVVLHYLEYDA